MTIDVLEQLRAAHAFDPAPRRHDLAAYHVPSLQLGVERDLEARLDRGVRNSNRVVVVGPSGCGKTSLIEYVFAPDIEGVAPIPVRLSPEPDEVVTSAQLVAEHVIHSIRDQIAMSAEARDKSAGRSTKIALSASWMGVSLGGELTRQIEATPRQAQTTAATFESLETLLRIVDRGGYLPVLIFDDTDRWFSRTNLGPAAAFFAKVLPEIRELPCSIVVTAHDEYVNNPDLRRHMLNSLEDRIDIPRLATTDALETVIQSRLRAHTAEAHVRDVVDAEAIAALWARYNEQPDQNLRDVFRTLHVSLTEACDDRLETIPAGLITTSDW